MANTVKIPELMTLNEVAKTLRMDPQTIARRARDGQIPGGIKIGVLWRFPRKKIEELIGNGVESSRGNDERGAEVQTGTD